MRNGFRIVAFGACFLVGCAANERYPQLQNIPLARKPVVPTTEQACQAAGGYWVVQGLPGGPQSCAMKATDARKICTDNTQCEGQCLVAKSLEIGSKGVGSCSDYVATFGCIKFLQNSSVVAMCGD